MRFQLLCLIVVWHLKTYSSFEEQQYIGRVYNFNELLHFLMFAMRLHPVFRTCKKSTLGNLQEKGGFITHRIVFDWKCFLKSTFSFSSPFPPPIFLFYYFFNSPLSPITMLSAFTSRCPFSNHVSIIHKPPSVVAGAPSRNKRYPFTNKGSWGSLSSKEKEFASLCSQ